MGGTRRGQGGAQVRYFVLCYFFFGGGLYTVKKEVGEEEKGGGCGVREEVVGTALWLESQESPPSQFTQRGYILSQSLSLSFICHHRRTSPH